MSKQLHTKNHYVPILYLSKWKDSKNKLYEYKLLVPHKKKPVWKSHPLKSLGYQKNLYTQVLQDGVSDRMEKWFGDFESKASRPLERAIAEESLSPDDWKKLINFLALQDLRTPKKLSEHIERNTPETLKEMAVEALGKVATGTDTINQYPQQVSNVAPFFNVEKVEDESNPGVKIEMNVGRRSRLYKPNSCSTSDWISLGSIFSSSEKVPRI